MRSSPSVRGAATVSASSAEAAFPVVRAQGTAPLPRILHLFCWALVGLMGLGIFLSWLRIDHLHFHP